MKSIQMVAEIGAVGLLMLLVVITGCQTTGSWITEVEDEMGPAVEDGIVVEPWGQIDGNAVHRYTLDNGRMRIRIIDGS